VRGAVSIQNDRCLLVDSSGIIFPFWLTYNLIPVSAATLPLKATGERVKAGRVDGAATFTPAALEKSPGFREEALAAIR
jgi:hypothetical protein